MYIKIHTHHVTCITYIQYHFYKCHYIYMYAYYNISNFMLSPILPKLFLRYLLHLLNRFSLLFHDSDQFSEE